MRIWLPRTPAEGVALLAGLAALIALERALGPYGEAARAGYLKIASLSLAIGCGCLLWQHMRRLRNHRRSFYAVALPVIAPIVCVPALIQTANYLFFVVGLPVNADVEHPAARVDLGDWWVAAVGLAATAAGYALFRADRSGASGDGPRHG